MTVKLLAKYHLEFLSLNGGCTGLSESTLVNMPHCWKSHVTAHIYRKVIPRSIKWERSGSVVERLTRDREAAGSSLTGITA